MTASTGRRGSGGAIPGPIGQSRDASADANEKISAAGSSNVLLSDLGDSGMKLATVVILA